MDLIRINITDQDGILLGTVELTPDELRAARQNHAAALALVDDIAGEAGVRAIPVDEGLEDDLRIIRKTNQGDL